MDEFSAVTAAAPLVIDLAERVRDVGGQVVVTAQSYQGLGKDDDERKRLIGAASGGLIVHRCVDPDELLKGAGTIRVAEQSWQLDSAGGSGMGSMRMAHKMAIDPDRVRQAAVGEAWVIADGSYQHMRVLPVGERPRVAEPDRPAEPHRPAERPPQLPEEQGPAPQSDEPFGEGGDPFHA